MKGYNRVFVRRLQKEAVMQKIITPRRVAIIISIVVLLILIKG